MKTKIFLLGIVSLFAISTSAFAQTGKTNNATTKGGGKKTSTVKSSSTKGGGKGSSTVSGGTTGTTAPANTPTKPSTDSNTGVKGGNGNLSVAGSTNQATAAVANTVDNPFQAIESSARPVVTETPNGSVNYTDQYIEARGSAVIDNDRFKNPAQAKLMAERGAVVVAQRNLLEIVKGVNVIGETTVEDMITTGDYVYTRVEGVVKGAKQFGPAREENGVMTVTLRMPLYDNTNGVAAGFTPAGLQNARVAAKANDPYTELVQTGADIIDGSKPIAFNIGGQKIDPSMFPVVMDENGKVLLDFSKIYEKSGKVPKIVQASKDLLDAAGLDKAANFIDLVQDKATGKFTLADTAKKGKINWAKIADVAGKVGKVLLNILL